MLFIYPAKFEKEEDGTYGVSFPDLLGCYSQGDNPKEAVVNACEALELYLSPDGSEKTPLEFPKASNIEDVKVEEGGFVSYISVEINLSAFDKSVKKNCTLPKWLSDKAESLGINFSKTLQEAILAKIEEL